MICSCRILPIFLIQLTRRGWKNSLDEIEEGKIDWRDAMQGFYDKFSVDLKNATENIKNVKKTSSFRPMKFAKNAVRGMVIKFGQIRAIFGLCKLSRMSNDAGSRKQKIRRRRSDRQTENGRNSAEEVPPCENCGKEMALKKGRFGSFYGCTGYPECKNIRKIAKEAGEVKTVAPPVEIDEKCPTCGKNLAIRQGRFGEFISCSDYPKCKYIKRETTGIPCPKCGKGEIAIKKSQTRKSLLRLHKLSEMR